MKISPLLLRLHNKSLLLQQKLKGFVFIGVYIINTILDTRLEIRNFSSRVFKCFTHCSTVEEKICISDARAVVKLPIHGYV